MIHKNLPTRRTGWMVWIKKKLRDENHSTHGELKKESLWNGDIIKFSKPNEEEENKKEKIVTCWISVLRFWFLVSLYMLKLFFFFILSLFSTSINGCCWLTLKIFHYTIDHFLFLIPYYFFNLLTVYTLDTLINDHHWCRHQKKIINLVPQTLYSYKNITHNFTL